MKRNIFVFMFVVLALFLGFVYVTGCGTGSTGGGTPVSVPDIYVSITGSDTTGEGTESNPYRTINKAMSVATTGDIILVKNGLYNDGTITWSPTVEGITLRGESKELTTLEGSSAVIDLFDIVASQTVVIENLTITGGTISGDGGGIGVNTDINLTVKNSILSNNKARIGGAIFFDSSGSLSLENCTFLNNDVGSQDNGTSRNGGAVFAGSGATLTALNCSFVGNVAMSTSTYIRGGAVCFEGDANFTNCAFTSNSSSKEGGAIYSGSGAAKIYKCFFKGNNSGGSGGAIYCSPSYASEIVNCILILNEAGTAATGNGGAIYAVGSGTLEVINCTVVSNECNNWGGGISDYDNVRIKNCIFWGNIGSAGAEDIRGRNGYIEYTDASVWPTGVNNGPVTHEGIDPRFDTFPPTTAEDVRLTTAGFVSIVCGATSEGIPADDYSGAIRDPSLPNAGSYPRYSLGAWEQEVVF